MTLLPAFDPSTLMHLVLRRKPEHGLSWLNYALAALTLLITAPAAAQSPTAASAAPTVASPDGRIVVTVGADDQGQPTYALNFAGRGVLTPSTLGLQFEQYRKLSTGMAIIGTDRRSGEDRYTLPAGKVSAVAERYNEIVVHLAEVAGDRRRLDVVFRAYDTGIALRYRIPRQPNLPRLRLFNELTSFAFAADYECTGLNLGGFGSSHEGEFDAVRASTIRAHNLYELPLVCRTGDDKPSIAIAEADVTDWPVMYLTGTEAGALGVAAKLSPQIDDPAIGVKANIGAGLQSPWRVVMIGRSAGALIENTLLTSLNPAPTGDFTWVKPGKSAWDWWSGPILAAVPNPGSNAATLGAFIDFAAEQHFAYMTIDDGWYVNSGTGPIVSPGADPMTPIAAVNLPGLIVRATAGHVGLLVWLNWQLLFHDADMERILARYQRWGLKGIKVDFMNRDDQEMVDFYHRLAAATARHHLLLDLHGATHPWGLNRTYPNFITQEGVFGAEYNKWTKRVTARHNVTLAYTRMLAGPMDYTPGGFRNQTPATFRITATGPNTQTTRGQALAMFVVFDSPLMMVADSPDAYRGQPGLEFLREVPTTWDETRFLGGGIGEDIVIARRSGTRWYVGAMTNEAARTVKVSLGFLGAGRYTARTWLDGKSPTELVTASRSVRANDTLALALAGSGGAVAVLEPAR